MVHVDADHLMALARNRRGHARPELAEADDRKTSAHVEVARIPKRSQLGSTQNSFVKWGRSSPRCAPMYVTTSRVLSQTRVTSSSGQKSCQMTRPPLRTRRIAFCVSFSTTSAMWLP